MRGSLSRETDQRTALTRLKRARACSLGSLPHLLNEFLPNKRRTPFLFVTTLPQLGFCVDKLSESIISSLPLSLFLLRARALSLFRSQLNSLIFITRFHFSPPPTRRRGSRTCTFRVLRGISFISIRHAAQQRARARTGALSRSLVRSFERRIRYRIHYITRYIDTPAGVHSHGAALIVRG